MKGIKDHEELQVIVDEAGSGTVWVRIVRRTEKGEAGEGIEIPLTRRGAINAARHMLNAERRARPKPTDE